MKTTATRTINTALIYPELEISTSRSSGPGGQNVNKVNSKVTVRFSIDDSRILSAEEKEFLLRQLSKVVIQHGVLLVSAQENRSQADNKALALQKLDKLIARAFVKRKTRKATKPTKGAVQKRIQSKKKNAEKKQWRQKL